jgi:hypothetical protein
MTQVSLKILDNTVHSLSLSILCCLIAIKFITGGHHIHSGLDAEDNGERE